MSMTLIGENFAAKMKRINAPSISEAHASLGALQKRMQPGRLGGFHETTALRLAGFGRSEKPNHQWLLLSLESVSSAPLLPKQP